jgi:hypothetical protein
VHCYYPSGGGSKGANDFGRKESSAQACLIVRLASESSKSAGVGRIMFECLDEVLACKFGKVSRKSGYAQTTCKDGRESLTTDQSQSAVLAGEASQRASVCLLAPASDRVDPACCIAWV